jgi:hypothetical protein
VNAETIKRRSELIKRGYDFSHDPVGVSPVEVGAFRRGFFCFVEGRNKVVPYNAINAKGEPSPAFKMWHAGWNKAESIHCKNTKNRKKVTSKHAELHFYLMRLVRKYNYDLQWDPAGPGTKCKGAFRKGFIARMENQKRVSPYAKPIRRRKHTQGTLCGYWLAGYDKANKVAKQKNKPADILQTSERTRVVKPKVVIGKKEYTIDKPTLPANVIKPTFWQKARNALISFWLA